jgi:hypothetical protein
LLRRHLDAATLFCANQIRRLVQRVCISVLGAALGVVLFGLGAHVEIVMKAAGIPKNAAGIGGFVTGAHALVQLAPVMVSNTRITAWTRSRIPELRSRLNPPASVASSGSDGSTCGSTYRRSECTRDEVCGGWAEESDTADYDQREEFGVEHEHQDAGVGDCDRACQQ